MPPLYFSGRKTCIITTIFNLANCFPEIVVLLIVCSIVTTFNNDVSSVLIMGSIGYFIGAIYSLIIIDPINHQ